MSKVFFRGIPTKIDVEKLLNRYGVPKEGFTVEKKAIAETLELDVKSHRFGTVLTAWRNRLFREHNILMVSIGEGVLKAASPDERVDYSSRKVSSGRRAIGKAIVVAYATDANRLTDESAKTRASICAMNEAKLRLAAGVQPKF